MVSIRRHSFERFSIGPGFPFFLLVRHLVADFDGPAAS